jgi:hypothetical protein
MLQNPMGQKALSITWPSLVFQLRNPDVDVSRHRDLGADASFDNSHVRM